MELLKEGMKLDVRNRKNEWLNAQIKKCKAANQSFSCQEDIDKLHHLQIEEECVKYQGILIHYDDESDSDDEWVFSTQLLNLMCHCDSLCHEDICRHKLSQYNTQSIFYLLSLSNYQNDLTNPQCQEIMSYKNFAVGTHLDVRDKWGEWYVAQIKNYSPTSNGVQGIFVHYDGWKEKWDEWIFDSNLSNLVCDCVSVCVKGQLHRMAMMGTQTIWSRNNDVKGKPNIDGFVGLTNCLKYPHPNSSFINCIIQCLSQTQVFKQYFINDEFERDLRRKNNRNNPFNHTLPSLYDGKIINGFVKLIEKIWSNKYEIIAPTKFYELLLSKADINFKKIRDAHPFLLWFLQVLHEELNYATKKISISGQDFFRENQSKIIDLFYGMFVE